MHKRVPNINSISKRKKISAKIFFGGGGEICKEQVSVEKDNVEYITIE